MGIPFLHQPSLTVKRQTLDSQFKLGPQFVDQPHIVLPAFSPQFLDSPAPDRHAQRSPIGLSMDDGNVDESPSSRFGMVGSDSSVAGSFVHDRCGGRSRAPNP